MKKKIIMIAIVALFLIGFVTLHLCQPKVSYALAELLCSVAFVGGGVVGYLLKEHIC